ncbi:uncharacterized protein LOC116208327 isoform X2 [Punica granatum]|uniref:Uncharacterized protein LOC116208327 isoform X2 n=1 Tax=Punica granatum TaxID=22663 RepID=A0A6P8DYV7_PUNGR|nr:uncharacterized protein LOC116208327 isoform X2 [Punica granatum]
MEASIDVSGTTTCNENVGTRIPPDSEAKPMQCTSNYEDNDFDVDTLADLGQKRELGDEYVEVDIINGASNPGDIIEIQETIVGQDSTESSSSFSGSLSGAENGSALSDGEVESQYTAGHMPGFYFPGLYEGFTTRKKRLTDHWRRFIRPVKWRCLWLELQIKELQSRALDKNVMKRRKRKRIEETVDIASYMSNHNLFSYFAKKYPADRALAKDGNGSQAIANGVPSLGVDDSLHRRDGDTSMEQILAKIVIAQSQIQQLKTRIEKVISENPGKFSSVNRLSSVIPGSAGTASDEDPASPPANGQFSPVKSLYAASQLVSEHDVGDLLLPNHAVVDHGGMTSLPDVVESTNQTEDGVLIDNRAAKEKLLNFEKVGDEQEKSERQLERQKKVVSTAEVPEAALPVETPSPLEASNVKSRPSLKTYISNNKRKRRRKVTAPRKKTKRVSG